MRFLIALTLVLVTSASVFAHGTGYRSSSLKPVALEFVYSTGETMSYREAKVFSPKDGKFAYQSGRTDENGRFSFVPDVSGKWRVIVRDEEGHQCTAELDVTVNEGVSVPQSHTDLVTRAILGVSIIFNIAMIIRWKNAHQ